MRPTYSRPVLPCCAHDLAGIHAGRPIRQTGAAVACKFCAHDSPLISESKHVHIERAFISMFRFGGLTLYQIERPRHVGLRIPISSINERASRSFHRSHTLTHHYAHSSIKRKIFSSLVTHISYDMISQHVTHNLWRGRCPRCSHIIDIIVIMRRRSPSAPTTLTLSSSRKASPSAPSQ